MKYLKCISQVSGSYYIYVRGDNTMTYMLIWSSHYGIIDVNNRVPVYALPRHIFSSIEEIDESDVFLLML